MPLRPPDFPIQDHGVIGNCEAAALVNRRAGIDWLCLPAFDGGSFFGALLDREKGGEFAIHPAESCEATQRYLDDTAILETRFATSGGTVAVTDFFVIARQRKARFYDFISLHPTQKLVRTITLAGDRAVPMRVAVRARSDYARTAPDWREVRGGFATAAASLFTDLELTLDGDDLVGEFLLEPGAQHFAVPDYSAERTAPNFPTIARWRQITASFWCEWNLFNYYCGPHRAIVRRSAVTLKLLTFAPTGAFVAAPTTSLPEVPGGDANWDYRFTWLRDIGLLIDTLFRLGYSGEAKAFLQFIVRQAARDHDSLGVLYSIHGGPVPEEEELSHLRGYLESQPVRVGNRARDQLQLDTFAHVLEACSYYEHTGGTLDAAERKLIEKSIETLIGRWREPENGVWESVEERLYTYGKVMAWVGLATAAKLVPKRADELCKIGETIREEILAKGLKNSDGQQFLAEAYDNEEVDAASLLAFTSDFLPLGIARATREKIERDLAEGALVFRNGPLRQNGEGAFLLCSFWFINHLLKEGEVARAGKLLDELLQRLGPLGLFSEEIDPATGSYLGNFPQAFSHLGLIGTILNLDLAQRKPELAWLSDHEKFEKTVGPTVGLRGVLAGFLRVPKTFTLLFASRSKWR